MTQLKSFMHLYKFHNGNFIIYFELLAVSLNSFLFFFGHFLLAVSQSLMCYYCQEFSFFKAFFGVIFLFYILTTG